MQQKAEALYDHRTLLKVERSAVETLDLCRFDNQKHILVNVALGGLYPFSVNGIRIPYSDLPEETIQLMRREEIRRLVDWVKMVGM